MVDVDPIDRSQQLDEGGEYHVELVVEARPEAERVADIDLASVEASTVETRDELDDVPTQPHRRDVGELYGVHTTFADDHDLTASEDRDAFADAELGTNWLDALEKKSVESGPEPEQEIELIDDSDRDHRGHNPTERDRPVADKGSGGIGGM